MRLSRLFIDIPLAVGQEIVLAKESTHYLLNVLRQRIGTQVTLFNGQGGEYVAHLIAATKKNAHLQVTEYKNIERESTLQLTLVQAISRPEHMDYTMQKAVELGVQRIVPITTERSLTRNREQRWRKIVISACEQCGRNRLPQLDNVLSLNAWLAEQSRSCCIVLSPTGKHALNIQSLSGAKKNLTNLTVLIGAEGGLSEAEIEQTRQAGYLDIRLGPRILRTETAAVTVLALCQALWGDLQESGERS